MFSSGYMHDHVYTDVKTVFETDLKTDGGFDLEIKGRPFSAKPAAGGMEVFFVRLSADLWRENYETE